jgi:hypothetical protein
MTERFDQAAGAMFRLTPTEHVRVRSASEESLAVDATYQPVHGGRVPPMHVHPHQDEHFTVRRGTLTVRMDGASRTFGAGRSFAVPRGTAHAMWNGSGDVCEVRWETRPALRTLSWWQALDELAEQGRPPGLLTLAGPLREHTDEFRLAIRPAWAGRVLLACAALLDRSRPMGEGPRQG